MIIGQDRIDKAKAEMRAIIDAGQPFFTRDLADCAIRLGVPKDRARTTASALCQAEKVAGRIVQAGNEGAVYIWQLASSAPRHIEDAPLPRLVAPVVQGPYDPPAELEGANSGLTETLAEHLWITLGGGDAELMTMKATLGPIEADGWRRVAHDIIDYLGDLGFTGPGGPPRREVGWAAPWNYDCGDWEIVDADQGCVCLVPDERSVPLLLAAPIMAAAIRTVLARVETNGGVKRSDLDQLRQAIEGLPT